MIDGVCLRKRAASSSALSDCAVTASRKVGKVEVGAEPPPISDSPATTWLRRRVPAFDFSNFSVRVLARRRIWSPGGPNLLTNGRGPWFFPPPSPPLPSHPPQTPSYTA